MATPLQLTPPTPLPPPTLLCPRSKKYQELVKKAGGEAPAPIVTLRKLEAAAQQGESC